jgi:predicted N-acetyltransferase YhbS
LTYLIEQLGDDHDLTAFSCGSAELDAWLRDHARAATGQGTRTYMMVGEDERVVGYFAIAPHTIDRADVSNKTGRGAPRHIPAILLAKLALDECLHGQRLGSELLVAALDTIVDAARRAGGKFVVVDAIDESAAAFYAHHEFEPMPSSPLRFTRKLSTIAKALGRPWP